MSVVDIHDLGMARFAVPGIHRRPITSHEFNWVPTGEFAFDRPGSPRRSIGPGVLAYDAPRGDITQTWGAGRQEIAWVLFSCDAEPTLPAAIRLDPDAVAVPLLQHLLWLGLGRPDGWMSAAIATLDYLVLALTTGNLGTSLGLPHRESAIVRDALGHLVRVWRTPPLRAVPLTELAAAAHVSREHLSRVFTAELGLPPLRFIRLLRLDRAGVLLGRTDLPIRDIAYECGFTNEYHFSTAFKRLTGTSPGAFRRRGSPLEVPPAVRLVGRHLLG